jgi:hypothetical protein
MVSRALGPGMGWYLFNAQYPVEKLAKFKGFSADLFKAVPQQGRVGEKLRVVVSNRIGAGGADGNDFFSIFEDLKKMEGESPCPLRAAGV